MVIIKMNCKLFIYTNNHIKRELIEYFFTLSFFSVKVEIDQKSTK